MVETIRDTEKQQEVTFAYLEGKSKHCGGYETLQTLKRQYIWWGMTNTIKEVRSTPTKRKEETPAASAPLSDLQVDTFTWRGYK